MPVQVLEPSEQGAPKYSQYSVEVQVLPKEPPQALAVSTHSARSVLLAEVALG